MRGKSNYRITNFRHNSKYNYITEKRLKKRRISYKVSQLTNGLHQKGIYLEEHLSKHVFRKVNQINKFIEVRNSAIYYLPSLFTKPKEIKKLAETWERL